MCLIIDRVAPENDAATMTNKLLPFLGKRLPLATCLAHLSTKLAVGHADSALQSPGHVWKMLMLVMQKPSILPAGTKELFKAAFGDDMSLEQYSKNKADLEGVVELKQQQARFWAENFPRWSQLADQVRTLSKAESNFSKWPCAMYPSAFELKRESRNLDCPSKSLGCTTRAPSCCWVLYNEFDNAVLLRALLFVHAWLQLGTIALSPCMKPAKTTVVQSITCICTTAAKSSVKAVSIIALLHANI